MKKLELDQMEQIKGEGCLEYAIGVAMIIYGGPFAFVGLGLGIANSRSCAAELA